MQSPSMEKPGRGSGRHIETGLWRSLPLSHHILSKFGVDKQSLTLEIDLRISHPEELLWLICSLLLLPLATEESEAA